MISLQTFENSVFGGSEFDTPIEDQKWSGCFVERIWGSDRVSSIGVIEITSVLLRREHRLGSVTGARADPPVADSVTYLLTS